MPNKILLTQGNSEQNPIQCSDITTPTCSFKINALILKENNNENSGVAFVQDIVSGALFFIGIFVSITLVISGLLYIFAGADEKQAEKGKTGVKYSLIGLFLVVASYAIIKVVQIIAKGG